MLCPLVAKANHNRGLLPGRYMDPKVPQGKDRTVVLLLGAEMRSGAVGKRTDVRFGSKADIRFVAADVRFTPESGHLAGQ